MKMIKPIAMTDATLLAHSVTEADYAVWAVGTTYAAGAKVIMTTGVHKIYESVAGGNVGNNPSTTTGFWIDLGATNRWKMFDQGVGSLTTDTDEIAVKIALADADYVNAVALLGVSGNSALIELLDATDTVLWSQESLLYEFDTSLSVDWYNYFFSVFEPLDSMIVLNLPRYTSARLRVTISGDGPVSIGTLAFGKAVDLGATQWSPQLGITDYSTKETDVYGVTTVLERSYATTLNADFFFPHSLLRRVFKTLADVRATPTVWIGSEDSAFDVTIVYGFFKNFNIVLQHPGGSFCNLEVEGLT